jgi:hypothetical protein
MLGFWVVFENFVGGKVWRHPDLWFSYPNSLMANFELIYDGKTTEKRTSSELLKLLIVRTID